MPIQNSNDSEQSFSEGKNVAEQIGNTSINAAKNGGRKLMRSPEKVKKGFEALRKTGEKAIKISTKIGKGVAEKGAQLIEFLLANPEILIVVLIVIVIILAIVVICSVSGGWMRKDDSSKKPWLEEEDRNEAYSEIVDLVTECVDEANEAVVTLAEETCEKYVEENFDDHETEIEYIVMCDTSEQVAEHITPYILAVNGAIQYDVDDTGLGPFMQIKKPVVLNENEYNTIGSRFKDVVKEYAENQLFYLDEDHLVDEVKLEKKERVITDEEGNPLLDQFGNEQTEEVEVYIGTIYIGIGYYIGDYKKDDIEQAVKNIYDERKDLEVHSELKTYAEYVEEFIYDLIFEETGSREYSLWGGYGEGIVPIIRSMDRINFEDLDLTPGSIEMLLALGSHGIQADWALLNELEKAQKAGLLTMKSRTEEGYPYCTEWAHFFMYLAYGRDYNTNPGTDGGDGNGANIARTLAMRNPADWYIPSDGLPTAGAIFSVTRINDGAGHVGMITKVEGDRVWYCDGNVGGHGYNIRLNVSCTLEEFVSRYPGGIVYFANHR